MLLGGLAQLLLELIRAPGQGCQLWRIGLKQPPPERRRRIEQQAAVLEEGRAMPELGAADALGTTGSHQVGRRGGGETAAALGRGHRAGLTEVQGLSGLGEGDTVVTP